MEKKLGATPAQSSMLARMVESEDVNTWRDGNVGFFVGYWLDGSFWNLVSLQKGGEMYWIPERHRTSHRSTATGWALRRYGYTRVNEDLRYRYDRETDKVDISHSRETPV